MSLILEALKKSEAERRIGEAPGLLTPSATPRATKRASRAWLWAVLALLLLLALVAAWWLGRMGGSETRPATDTPVVATTTATPASTTAGSTAPATSETTAAQPSNTRARSGSAASADPAPPPAAPPRQANTTPAVRQPPVDRAPRAPGERESLPVAPGELPVPPVDSTATPTAAARPEQVAPNRRTEPTDAAPAPPRESLPRLHQLDGATRSELPPLRISMHVFTDVPGGRFVIIDNHRYAEGASVASGLNIAEIRRDGVVMDYRGRRFLLDRPG